MPKFKYLSVFQTFGNMSLIEKKNPRSYVEIKLHRREDWIKEETLLIQAQCSLSHSSCSWISSVHCSYFIRGQSCSALYPCLTQSLYIICPRKEKWSCALLMTETWGLPAKCNPSSGQKVLPGRRYFAETFCLLLLIPSVTWIHLSIYIEYIGWSSRIPWASIPEGKHRSGRLMGPSKSLPLQLTSRTMDIQQCPGVYQFSFPFFFPPKVL